MLSPYSTGQANNPDPAALAKISAAMLSAIRAAEFVHGVARQMRIACRGLDLAVAEQLSDHRETFAERQRPRRVTVSEIVDTHILEVGPRPHDEPGVVEIAQPRARLRADDDPGIVGETRQGPSSTRCAAGDRATDRALVLASRR